MGLAHLLSRVTTPVFMSVVYFLILSPIGLAMRMFGRHPLGRYNEQSRWITRPEGSRRSTLSRQF